MREWKWVAGYEGKYQVSNDGRVRSVDRAEECNGATRSRKGVELSPIKKKAGYLTVNLYANSSMKTVLVHRLVAEAFIPNPEHKREVNHISGDKSDNRVENLEWVTPSENVKHAFDVLGRKAPHNGQFNDDQVRDIRASSETHKAIAKRYGVSRSLIGQIKNGSVYKEVT